MTRQRYFYGPIKGIVYDPRSGQYTDLAKAVIDSETEVGRRILDAAARDGGAPGWDGGKSKKEPMEILPQERPRLDRPLTYQEMFDLRAEEMFGSYTYFMLEDPTCADIIHRGLKSDGILPPIEKNDRPQSTASLIAGFGWREDFSSKYDQVLRTEAPKDQAKFVEKMEVLREAGLNPKVDVGKRDGIEFICVSGSEDRSSVKNFLTQHVKKQKWEAMASPTSGKVLRVDLTEFTPETLDQLKQSLRLNDIGCGVIHSQTFEREYLEVSGHDVGKLQKLLRSDTNRHGTKITSGNKTTPHVG